MSITAKAAKKFEGALKVFGENILEGMTRIALSPVITASTSPNKRHRVSHYITVQPNIFSASFQAQRAAVARKKIADLPNRKFSGPVMLISGILMWPLIIVSSAVEIAFNTSLLAITSVVAAVTLAVTGCIDGVKALDKKVKAGAKAKKAQGMQDNPLYEAATPKDNPVFQPYGEYDAPAPIAKPKAKSSTFSLKAAFSKLTAKKAKKAKQTVVVAQQTAQPQPEYAYARPQSEYFQPQPYGQPSAYSLVDDSGLFVGAGAPSMPVTVAAAGDDAEVSETSMRF